MAALKQRYRKAFVTGASSGLGRELTSILLRDGVEVWGGGRDVSGFPENRRFHPVVADLSTHAGQRTSADQVSEEAGYVDLLVNNAGFGTLGAVDSERIEPIRQQMEVMLLAPQYFCGRFVGGMKEAGRGCIVNVSSLAALFPLPRMAGYNAAKAGLSAFSQSLMEELRGTGVQIVDFQPGDFRTGFNRKIAEAGPNLEPGERALWERMEERILSGPEAARIAARLVEALTRNRSGIVRSGTVSQSLVFPFFARFASRSLLRFLIRMYYTPKA